MPRIARAVAIDYPHHITQRGNNCCDVFFDDEDREFYCDTLIRYSKKCDLEIWSPPGVNSGRANAKSAGPFHLCGSVSLCSS